MSETIADRGAERLKKRKGKEKEKAKKGKKLMRLRCNLWRRVL